MRRFEVVSAYRERVRDLPRRQTAGSAGYDLAAAEEVVVPPHGVAMVPTGVKAFMAADEFLAVFVRSSLAVQRGLCLANGVGVIDADYTDNPVNEGHIQVPLYNLTDQPVHIAAGERIAQGIFLRYGVVDGDRAAGVRRGGFGSTGSH